MPTVQSTAVAGTQRSVQSVGGGSNPIVGGVIQAVSANSINIKGDGNCGYVDVSYGTGTQINLNGNSLAAGMYLSVYGTGNCGTSFTATQLSVSSTTPAISGTIYGVSGNTINLQAGSCGYVNATYASGTAIWYNGFSLGSGTSATVYGTGTCGTSFVAARIVLTAGASPSPSPSPNPSATATPLITGTIYAISGNTINLQAGSCGYVNVTYSGSTQIILNGYTLTKGVIANVWGSGSCGTSFAATTIALGVLATPTPSPTPTPTPTPSPLPSPTAPPVVLSHIVTADYCCGGFSNDTPVGGVATAKPWVNYFAGPSASVNPTGTYPSYGTTGLANAGISPSRVYMYIDDSRIYSGTAQYNNIAPGGAEAAAEAKDCNGNIITVSNNTGYLSDPLQAATLQIYDADVSTEYNSSSEYGVVFFDDINGYEYNDNSAMPCTSGTPWSQSSISSIYGSLLNGITVSNLAPGHAPPALLVNTLGPMMIEAKGNVSTLLSSIANLASVPSLIGMDCEGCIADSKNAEIGLNTPYELSNQWLYLEDAGIALVNAQKIFWSQNQDSQSTGTNSYNGRLYAFASFMLIWDPTYTVYQNAYYNFVGDGEHANATNPQLHIFPEEQLVAYSPMVPYPTTSAGIGALKDPGGTYVREYQLCYYAGVKIGNCAFVVNPDSVSHTSPTLRGVYGHRMAITTESDIVDGGTVMLNGYAMGTSVPALTGYVLLP